MDVFDGVPDAVIIDILNKVGDVKTLLGCTSLSKRFNSLVPHSESLFLRLDHHVPVSNIFQSLFNTFQSLFSVFTKPAKPIPNLSPAKILSRFERIQNLEIELPGAHVKVDKGASVRWKAEFGKTLKSCVILAFRSASTVSSAPLHECQSDAEFVTGLKTRVVWTISALISAATRHHLMREVVKEHKEIKTLVVRDQQGEGTLLMGSEGLREFRDTLEHEHENDKKRSVVPGVKMSMRHAPWLKLKSGISLESATLVVVRPTGIGSDVGDDELATEAFPEGCMHGEAVAALLKCKENGLEVNEF